MFVKREIWKHCLTSLTEAKEFEKKVSMFEREFRTSKEKKLNRKSSAPGPCRHFSSSIARPTLRNPFFPFFILYLRKLTISWPKEEEEGDMLLFYISFWTILKVPFVYFLESFFGDSWNNDKGGQEWMYRKYLYRQVKRGMNRHVTTKSIQ